MASTTTNLPQHTNPGVAAVLAFAHKLASAGGQPASVQRTPNQWVQDTAAAGMLPRTCTNTSGGHGKAVGRALRGYVGRGTGNGVGRGRTYPATNARELLALGGYAYRAANGDTDKVRSTALGKAAATWGKAHARRNRASVQEAGGQAATPVQPAPAPDSGAASA